MKASTFSFVFSCKLCMQLVVSVQILDENDCCLMCKMTYCSVGWIIFLNYVHISDCLTISVIVFNVQMNRRLKMWWKNGKNLKQRLAGCAFKKVGKFNYIIFSEFLYSVTAFIGTIPQIMILIFGFSLPGFYFFDIFETWDTIGQWFFFSIEIPGKIVFYCQFCNIRDTL